MHRKVLQNPICNKPDYFSLFITLLLLSNHQDNCIIVNNSKTLIKRGQLLTSRLKLSQITGIQESKIERILKYLKSEQQIEQQNLVIGRLITIINYDTYQISEQQIEHGMNSERTRNEQRVNTINNDKNVKNDKKLYMECVYLSDEEYQKLLSQYKEAGTKQRIENLNLYIMSKGKKYKSHYHTILSWDRKNNKQDKPSPANITKENLKQFVEEMTNGQG